MLKKIPKAEINKMQRRDTNIKMQFLSMRPIKHILKSYFHLFASIWTQINKNHYCSKNSKSSLNLLSHLSVFTKTFDLRKARDGFPDHPFSPYKALLVDTTLPDSAFIHCISKILFLLLSGGILSWYILFSVATLW